VPGSVSVGPMTGRRGATATGPGVGIRARARSSCRSRSCARAAQLTRQHRERTRAMAAQRVGPNLGEPRRRLVARKASRGTRQAHADVVGGQRPRPLRAQATSSPSPPTAGAPDRAMPPAHARRRRPAEDPRPRPSARADSPYPCETDRAGGLLLGVPKGRVWLGRGHARMHAEGHSAKQAEDG
jgi:hypothetical protein